VTPRNAAHGNTEPGGLAASSEQKDRHQDKKDNDPDRAVFEQLHEVIKGFFLGVDVHISLLAHVGIPFISQASLYYIALQYTEICPSSNRMSYEIAEKG
jgi:hypothetical protein|tara:strand:- start:389 stop:685 length:297 start_codon:yes stop_codon:yes gene_type:complete